VRHTLISGTQTSRQRFTQRSSVTFKEAGMALKDLLVCIDPTIAGGARLKLALNLARTNKAHLTGTYPLPEAQVARGGATGFGGLPGMNGTTEETVSPGGAVSEVFHEAEVADQAEHRFKDELRLAGIDGEWHAVPDGNSSELIELAKSADMTIMGQRPPSSGSDGAARFRPEEIVIAAGRPVLVVPYAGIFETVGKRILVAWDGTREAIRALNDALPLLADAEAVIVMFVGTNERDLEQYLPALERIVHHLQRHGINATAEETLRSGLAVSDVLLSRAADLAADMIVAGGYHHSQLRETLIGGVTRDLLQHMTVPVLMSH
jgi:nucleotide-binding universal stress UspA family protein